MDNLKLETVSSTLSIYQKEGVFCYGTDAVLLAKYILKFYKSLSGKNMCDLCSGTGIIPLFLCDRVSNLTASALEINEDACTIAKMSADVSNLSDRFTQINGDIVKFKDYFAAESFDFVTCNPPYMTNDSGFMCKDDYKTIARHEILCNIDDVFRSAFYLLRTGGNFFIVYRSDRLSSLFSAARNNRFEIKDMISVISGSVPAVSKLVIVRAMKDASEGLKHSVFSISDFDL